MPAEVLLIGAEWQPRALIRAQLLEEGYDVTAVESWDEGELLLRRRAVTPGVIVFDVDGESQPEAALTTLRRLARNVAVLVLTSASALPASAIEALGFEHVLARPYRIQDVTKRVRPLVGSGSNREGRGEKNS